MHFVLGMYIKLKMRNIERRYFLIRRDVTLELVCQSLRELQDPIASWKNALEFVLLSRIPVMKGHLCL